MNIIPQELYNHEIANFFSEAAITATMKDMVLATTTMYPSKDGVMSDSNALRGKLALESFKKAKSLNIPVYVVDGGSDAGWRAEAERHGAILIDENGEGIEGTHFMGRSRRQVLTEAANAGKPVVAWVEPEKHPIIAHSDGHSPIVNASVPVYTGTADIIVPRRVDELAGYPLQQRMEELTGNLTIMEMLQGELRELGHENPEAQASYTDQWIGPRAISLDSALPYFLNFKGVVGVGGDSHDRWESIFVPVWNAILDGKVVRGVPVDYVHPAEQSALESGNPDFAAKRVDQLQTIVSACAKYIASR